MRESQMSQPRRAIAFGRPEAGLRANKPGYWRRIEIWPELHSITAGLEDDFHRFHLRLGLANGVITGIDAHTLRAPWSACPGAGEFLASQAIGKNLADFRALDPHSHCTHLYDLVKLCAAHQADGPTRLDISVDDRVDHKTQATLRRNGDIALQWDVDGMTIAGPDGWADLDLRQISTWKQSRGALMAEYATLLNKALYISYGRTMVDDLPKRAADRGPTRLGVCFNYQLPRAEHSFQLPNWRSDFSQSGEAPLADFEKFLENV